jgi:hypothetical protein
MNSRKANTWKKWKSFTPMWASTFLQTKNNINVYNYK